MHILFYYLAKRKLEISHEKITVYSEVDGTEIDEDTFPELEPGTVMIIAKGDETWVPQNLTTTASTIDTSAKIGM